MRADVVDRKKVRVVELSRCVRLLLEAPESIRIPGKGGGKYLDRHFAVEPGIAGAIHLPHTARTERSDDGIGAEPGASDKGHRRFP